MTAQTKPDFTTPEALAFNTGWSERRIRKIARGLGACRVLGNRMILTTDDVKAILEASKPCPSNSISAGTSGITGALSPVGGYPELQALRTKQQPKGSQRKPKHLPSVVTLMDRGRK